MHDASLASGCPNVSIELKGAHTAIKLLIKGIAIVTITFYVFKQGRLTPGIRNLIDDAFWVATKLSLQLFSKPHILSLIVTSCRLMVIAIDTGFYDKLDFFTHHNFYFILQNPLKI